MREGDMIIQGVYWEYPRPSCPYSTRRRRGRFDSVLGLGREVQLLHSGRHYRSVEEVGEG